MLMIQGKPQYHAETCWSKMALLCLESVNQKSHEAKVAKVIPKLLIRSYCKKKKKKNQILLEKKQWFGSFWKLHFVVFSLSDVGLIPVKE